MPDSRFELVPGSELIRLYDRVWFSGGFVAAFQNDGAVVRPRAGFAVWATQVPSSAPVDVDFYGFCMLLRAALEGYPERLHMAVESDGEDVFVGPVDVYVSRHTAKHFALLRQEPVVLDLATGAGIPVGEGW